MADWDTMLSTNFNPVQSALLEDKRAELARIKALNEQAMAEGLGVYNPNFERYESKFKDKMDWLNSTKDLYSQFNNMMPALKPEATGMLSANITGQDGSMPSTTQAEPYSIMNWGEILNPAAPVANPQAPPDPKDFTTGLLGFLSKGILPDAVAQALTDKELSDFNAAVSAKDELSQFDNVTSTTDPYNLSDTAFNLSDVTLGSDDVLGLAESVSEDSIFSTALGMAMDDTFGMSESGDGVGFGGLGDADTDADAQTNMGGWGDTDPDADNPGSSGGDDGGYGGDSGGFSGDPTGGTGATGGGMGDAGW